MKGLFKFRTGKKGDRKINKKGKDSKILGFNKGDFSVILSGIFAVLFVLVLMISSLRSSQQMESKITELEHNNRILIEELQEVQRKELIIEEKQKEIEELRNNEEDYNKKIKELEEDIEKIREEKRKIEESKRKEREREKEELMIASRANTSRSNSNNTTSTTNNTNSNKGVLIGEFTATAYDLSVDSTGKRRGDAGYGLTASGYNIAGMSRERAMTIATDPRVIPRGSKVRIEFSEPYTHFSGVYTARDTGGAIKGNKVDIFLGDFNQERSHESVARFGVRKVNIYRI